ncbi:hypothetical protein BDC45DRAFT_536590 [Circinella umbellata]|nr:hypothetical protein BDC45DRAFT_536590 [Circinella umbellata]
MYQCKQTSALPLLFLLMLDTSCSVKYWRVLISENKQCNKHSMMIDCIVNLKISVLLKTKTYTCKLSCDKWVIRAIFLGSLSWGSYFPVMVAVSRFESWHIDCCWLMNKCINEHIKPVVLGRIVRFPVIFLVLLTLLHVLFFFGVAWGGTHFVKKVFFGHHNLLLIISYVLRNIYPEVVVNQ